MKMEFQVTDCIANIHNGVLDAFFCMASGVGLSERDAFVESDQIQ